MLDTCGTETKMQFSPQCWKLRYLVWKVIWVYRRVLFYIVLSIQNNTRIYAFEECIWTLHKKYLKYLTMH